MKGNRCDHQKNPSPKKISQCAAEYIFESSFEPIKVIVYWSSDRCIRLAIADSCKFHEIWLVFLALFFLVFCAIGECLLSIWTGNFVLSIETMCMVFNGVWPKIPFTTHKFIQISNIFSMAKTILNILSDETVKKKHKAKTTTTAAMEQRQPIWLRRKKSKYRKKTEILFMNNIMKQKANCICLIHGCVCEWVLWHRELYALFFGWKII